MFLLCHGLLERFKQHVVKGFMGVKRVLSRESFE